MNEESGMDVDSFFELLSKFQSKRMDDQRCTLSIDSNKENKEPSPASPNEENPAAQAQSSRPVHRPQSSPSASPNANGGIVNIDGAAAGNSYYRLFFLCSFLRILS